MAVNRAKTKKICALLGAHFALAPLSFVWIYGNLSAYMNSYFHFACYPQCLDADSQWILGLYVAGQFPGVLLVKPLARRLGLRWTGVGAMLLNNAVVLASAWSLQFSVAWTAAMYGIIMGPSVGVTHGVVVNLVSGWAPQWSAILMATATSFPTLLSIAQNQMITAYVNPENLKANTVVGPETFFSQPQLLDRVPGAVVLMAATTFGMQLVGYILVSDPPQTTGDVTKNGQVNSLQDQTVKSGDSDVQMLENGVHHQKDKANGTINTNCKTPLFVARKDNINNSDHHAESKDYNTQNKEEHSKPAQKDTPVSWKPSEVLRSPAYYAVLLFGIALEFGILLKANFYKEFAQRYIQNDRYLTLIGTLIPVTSVCSRIVLGLSVDKGYFTLKDAAVFGLSINSILCLFWFFIPQVSSILYLFLVLGLAMAQCLFWVVVPCSAIRLFGPDHLAVNFGLVQACVFLSSFVMPIVVPPIVRGLGWFWLFTCCGIFSLITLCFVVATSFDTQQRKQK
ncbi:hypothetical protein EGW08_014237 [Elysia chlorotica]|uniref:Major facilitator superfamily (MFS) profile domain-containing protein n=1 Tax=Elysia chlorotica TaxID=188477 RepID=A0A3S1HEZ9_ELYCH|nr:hypothetical protein EGW08_014237 [Elysia chlorotica]